MLHHPTGVARGQASDVHNEGRELLRTRDYMDATLSVACGRSFDAIQQVPPPPPALALAAPAIPAMPRPRMASRLHAHVYAWHACVAVTCRGFRP